MLKKLFCLSIWEGNARGRRRSHVAGEVNQSQFILTRGMADASLRWQELGAREEWGRGQSGPKEYGHGGNIKKMKEWSAGGK